MKYVYLLRAGQNHYKVGVAANVAKRVGGIQTGNPLQVEVVCMRLVDDAEAFERRLHEALHEQKLNGGSEWFDLTPEQALDLAVLMNKSPEVDISKQLTVNDLLDEQQKRQKQIERKLDFVLGEYNRLKAQKQKRREEHMKLQEMAARKGKEYVQDRDLETQALAIIREEGRVSTSLLQSRLSIGYGRAYRIIDSLEKQGIVGPLNGIHRELLIRV